MNIKDGIVYADDPTPMLEVSGVRALSDYTLWVRFNNGVAKIFDFKPLLDKPGFMPLQDVDIFNGVYIDYGCTVWQDGDIDIAPEYLYENGVTVGGVAND